MEATMRTRSIVSLSTLITDVTLVLASPATLSVALSNTFKINKFMALLCSVCLRFLFQILFKLPIFGAFFIIIFEPFGVVLELDV